MPGPLTEDELTAEVVARLETTPDPRLREIIQGAVRHLHAFTREVGLTEAEWLAGVGFLTAVGQMCDDRRQEFILLSDTLGLSSLVDIVAHGADEHATESTILGPFYVPGSPWRESGETIAESDDTGAPTLVTGAVRSLDGTSLGGAVLDVWQTASNGLYAVQDDAQPDGNMRGRFRADGGGRYAFRTVRPVSYSVPDDGPVGRLLRACGRHPWRAAHIHAIVSAEGHRSVTTHIFDRDNAYLESDTVFGVKDSLIEDFVPQADGSYLVQHDFVLRPAD
jgi:catechol 1,2-dioxygenase